MKPNERIQSALISSTSRFTGEFISDDLCITHAFSQPVDARGVATLTSNPICRNSFVISFITEKRDNNTAIYHDAYSELVQEITSYLAVIYGKRFDYHGMIQSEGHLFMPTIEQYQKPYIPHYSHNSHVPRKDIEVQLQLSEVERIFPLFSERAWVDETRTTLRTACRFYLQGLQLFEYQPETSYLSFVTIGEVLAKSYSFPIDDLLDEQLKDVLSEISKKMENSDKVVKIIKSRVRQIKRSYTKTILNLINDNFYMDSEDLRGGFPIKKENVEQCIKASYDLRSYRVHEGMDFEKWVSRAFRGSEVIPGTPICENKSLSKALSVAPTLSGIERMMRYALLSYMQKTGLKIDKKLNEN